MKRKTIAILYGGTSRERNISLKTGKMIYKAIDEKEFKKILIDTKNELFKLIEMIKNNLIDLCIIALHGKGGEDGTIQGFLETLNTPYVGSGVLSSSISMDKEISKILLSANKILTPKFKTLRKDESVNKSKLIPVPFVIKPVNEGSSIGIDIVKNKNEINKKIKKAFTFNNKIIIEEFIKGTEITVGIIDNIALPIVEIIPPKKNIFFDFKAKYSGKTQEIIPARISPTLTKKAKEIALKTFKILECKDLARVDMIIDNKNKIYVLEINTIPGMTSESLLPKEAKKQGMTFSHFIKKLIKLGLKNE